MVGSDALAGRLGVAFGSGQGGVEAALDIPLRFLEFGIGGIAARLGAGFGVRFRLGAVGRQEHQLPQGRSLPFTQWNRGHQLKLPLNKSEIRISKSETNPKYQKRKSQTGPGARRAGEEPFSLALRASN